VRCNNIQLLTFVEIDTMIYQPEEDYIYRGRRPREITSSKVDRSVLIDNILEDEKHCRNSYFIIWQSL